MMDTTPTSGRTWLAIGLLAVSVAIMAFSGPQPAYWGVFVTASLIAGGLCVYVWRRGDVDYRLVIGIALLLRLALFWMPPTLSDDAYRYVWDGVVQTEGINPYLYAPEDAELAHLHEEPVFDHLNSATYHSVYPPVSQLIFRVGAWFYESGWAVSYYVIKAIFAAMEFGAVLVLSRLIGPAGLLLYAWNPLVLITGAGQAHGEAALAFFFSLVLLNVHRRQGGWASFFLVLAGWVKLYPFVLFPFLWRRFGLQSAAVGFLTAAALAAPYLHPDAPAKILASLDLYVRLFEFNAGLYYGVKELFELATGADWSKQIGPAFRIVFLGLVPLLYVLDRRWKWSFRRACAITVGAFLLLSTTVHPWYLVGILILVVPARPPSWHWHWLAVVSMGTYLLYVGGPYWMWVVLGWSGWSVLLLWRCRRSLMDHLLSRRARGKARYLKPFVMDGDRILDIGAGEGFVSEELARRFAIEPELVDVVDMNRTRLPHTTYDGKRLPFEDEAFDVAVLVYVLHHTENPEAVIREALRISRRHVLILESTYERPWQGRLLTRIDRCANRLRSGGRMNTERIHLRTSQSWQGIFAEMDAPLATKEELGGFVHRKSLYVLDATAVPMISTSDSTG